MRRIYEKVGRMKDGYSAALCLCTRERRSTVDPLPPIEEVKPWRGGERVAANLILRRRSSR